MRRHGRSQLGERVRIEADRVGEEFPEKIDPRFALPHEHDAVVGVRIGPGGRGGKGARASLVSEVKIAPGGPLEGKPIEPPFHDPVGFGEEAVSAQVDAIPLVIVSSRQPADIGRFLQHHGDNIGSCKKFVGGGQSCRASACDDGDFATQRPSIACWNLRTGAAAARPPIRMGGSEEPDELRQAAFARRAAAALSFAYRPGSCMTRLPMRMTSYTI